MDDLNKDGGAVEELPSDDEEDQGSVPQAPAQEGPVAEQAEIAETAGSPSKVPEAKD